MRFVAAINTRIYGTYYAQGSDVDTANWTRKQMLQFLNLGLIQASAVTAGAIQDAVLFEGPNVTVDTNAEGQLVVTIGEPEYALDELTDVDTAGAADGMALVYVEAEGAWRPVAVELSGENIAFEDLSNVDMTGIEDLGIPEWNPITGAWQPGAAVPRLLSSLDDVNITTTPEEGDTLVWDFTDNAWRLGTAVGSIGPAGPAAYLAPVPWSSASLYSAGPPASVVTYLGSAYVAIATSTNQVPPSSPLYWRLLVSKGDTGPAGTSVVGPAGPEGPAGPGVPTGGTAGQVLTKDSGTDYDTSWQDPTGGVSITELDDVPDVNAPSPSDGQVLTWDSTPGEWVAASPSAVPSTLNSLTDVNTPSPTDGHVLTWDSTPGEWVSAAPPAGYTDEMARDAIGAALVEGSGIDITVNDAGDQITIATTGVASAPGSESFSHADGLFVGVAPFRLYNDSGVTRTLAKVRAAVGTAPTGSSIVIDVLKNGTSIWPTGTKPTITSGSQTDSRTPTTTAWANGDYLEVEIESIGSTYQGANLTVTVSWT